MIIKPKKSLGQNFLIDPNIIKNIIDLGNITSHDSVIEIGPGTGKLTDEIIIRRPKNILLIEKDKILSENLKTKYENKIEVLNMDILNFNQDNLKNKKSIIFGNLPYNISTQILIKFIISETLFKSISKMIFMFQKDVADRLISKCNEKNFGRLSVIANWRLKINKNFDVSPNCFYPKPKVDSTILTFEPLINYTKFKNPKNLEFITNVFFSKKRKMINKAYNILFKKNLDIAKSLDLDLKFRPSNIDSEKYYKITKEYEKLNI